MTNDQLTALSAKAIGLKLTDAPTDNGARIITPECGGGFWHPLQSGDDIVKLIAVLRLRIEDEVGNWYVCTPKHVVPIDWMPSKGHAAAMAALRLAVTNLAARIGMEMKE